MGDVLENLFSILPIAIAIFWVIRRVSRGRTGPAVKTTEKSPSPAQSLPASGPVSQPASRTVPGKPELTALKQRLRALEERLTDQPSADSRVQRSEDELYERIETRRITPSAPISTPVPDGMETERMVPGQPVVPEANRGLSAAGSIMNRLSVLPPLAQGILWSVILEPPPSLRDPTEFPGSLS